ncbi:MAG: endolytic transglycosylase MltG [Gammaproteobacteria bacterium]
MRTLLALILAAVLVLGGGAGAAWWWLDQPLGLRAGVPASPEPEFTIERGSSARQVASQVVRAGADVPDLWLHLWFRASGQARSIQAGTYALSAGLTPRTLLQRLVRGEQVLRSVTLVEGWTFAAALQALGAMEDLRQDLQGLRPDQIMERLGRAGTHPEGRFYPDTYRVPRHTPVSAVLLQAAQAMDQQLAQAWAQKHPDSPLRTPEEALILASIIEKETGSPNDRPLIGGVFSNRLRIGMRLQTDPTVIYGLGARFDGNLRKVHLQTDGPYNTYTRAGLPPTPIAMPGQASLMAAVRPAATRALYFVARGDGSSQFSETLDQHNAAVRRYILNR